MYNVTCLSTCTRSDLDCSVVLDEDRGEGEVAVDNIVFMQIARGDRQAHCVYRFLCQYSTT